MRCTIVPIADEPGRAVLVVRTGDDDPSKFDRPIEMFAEEAAFLADLLNAAPPAAPEPVVTLPGLDVVRLIHLVRTGDEAAVQEAYRRTFGSEMGRFVLAHHASVNGVGGLWEGPMDAETSNYRHGAQDAALKLALTAGFDSTSIAVMVLTDRLEGSKHDDSGQFGLGDGHGDGDGDGWDGN